MPSELTKSGLTTPFLKRIGTMAALQYNLPANQIPKIIIQFVKNNKQTTSFYIRPFFYTLALGIYPRLHNIEKDFFV
jgi:hypothetical protein